MEYVIPDGLERPIHYHSCNLEPHKKDYVLIEKERLSLVLYVKAFLEYLYGWKFTLLTEHQPLVGLLGEGKSILEITASPTQHWALTLSGYSSDDKSTP